MAPTCKLQSTVIFVFINPSVNFYAVISLITVFPLQFFSHIYDTTRPFMRWFRRWQSWHSVTKQHWQTCLCWIGYRVQVVSALQMSKYLTNSRYQDV